MTTLNLNTQQETNAQVAIGAANAVYDLNSGGAYLRVGQPLVYPPDLAGNTPGYTALPDAPAGYVVSMVHNDVQSGLNLFVAYNASTNTAIVGIAGVNGVLGGGAGSAADTMQIISGMKDQVAAMFKGSKEPDFVNGTGVPILMHLNSLAGGNGSNFKIILGTQSGGGPAADALTSSIKDGLTEQAQTALGITSLPDGSPDPRAIGISAINESNIFVTKVNTLGSEYTLTPLGLMAQGQELVANGATVTTIIAGDSSRNFTDPVSSYNGRQLGTTVKLDIPYPGELAVTPGSVLGWFHRNEGALANYFASGGTLNQLSTYSYNPLSMESMSAVMSAFTGMKWDSNAASYGGLAAIGLFAVAYSAPGESAQTIGKSLSAVFGSNDSEGFFTAVGGVIEAAVKYAAVTNPVGFVARLAVLLFGSKAINALIGSDNAVPISQLDAWAARMPLAGAGGTRQIFNDPSFGPTAVYTYGDRTVFSQIDGTRQTVSSNGSYQAEFANGAVLMQNPTGTGALRLTTGTETVYIPLSNNQMVSFVPAMDSNGNPVSGPGFFKIETYAIPGQTPIETLVKTDATWTQLTTTNGATTISTGTYFISGPITNLINLSTTTSTTPTQTDTPNPTTAPNDNSSTLISNADYSVNASGNVNTDQGNAAVGWGATADGVMPGAQKIWDAFGNTPLDTGFDASTANGAAQLGSNVNHQASGLTNVVPVDPLVLDLNGDGVKLSNYTDSPVLFDADNDGGSLEQTGWVSSQDGILVHDLNNDGKINNISETLSEYYNGVAGSNGTAGTKPYANGFAALKSLDSNADNQFTALDAAWSQLKVWQDANHDGKTDAGELKTFADLGITAINLNAVSQSGEVRDGNAVLARGSFTQTVIGNFVTKEAIAANFLANPAGSTITQGSSGVIVSTEGANTGTAASTSTYVSQNTLTTVNETLSTLTLNVKNLTGGAGADTLSGDSQNNWLAGGLGADQLYGGAGDDVLLIDANDSTVDGGDGLDIAQVIGSQGVTLNLASSNIEIAVGGDGNDVLIGGGRSTVFIRGGAGDDLIIGGAANDVLSGEDGDDLIDDSLSGGAGNDVLIGGRGDDQLDGGDGIDVAQYAGSYADYRITKIQDGTGPAGTGAVFRVVDTRTGQDGADTLTNIEKLSFSDVSRVDLSLGSPLPVKDIISTNSSGQALSRTGSHLLSKTQLLANDRDWDSDATQLSITQVLEAQGGTASLTQSGDVLFTPDASYSGVMSFKYKVQDAQGNTTHVTSGSTTEPMKAAVYLQTADLQDAQGRVDPLMVEQWYLTDTQVLAAWGTQAEQAKGQGYSGKGIRIGQFEPGGPFSTGPEVFESTLVNTSRLKKLLTHSSKCFIHTNINQQPGKGVCKRLENTKMEG